MTTTPPLHCYSGQIILPAPAERGSAGVAALWPRADIPHLGTTASDRLTVIMELATVSKPLAWVPVFGQNCEIYALVPNFRVIEPKRATVVTDDLSVDREATLSYLRHWYEETSNPLYAWEAIHRCFYNNDTQHIPAWCLCYLRGVAENLFKLSRGHDFRSPDNRIEPSVAIEQVAEALSLSSRGKRNAFAALRKEGELVGWGLDAEFGGDGFALGRIMKERNVDKTQAERVFRRARRLLGKNKT